MKKSRLERAIVPWRQVAGAAVLMVCVSALEADKVSPNDAQMRYQKERATCLSGQSNQDRRTCLQEADAAFAQARHEGLDDGTAPYARNARLRCEKLPDSDRQACLARMDGQGTTSGDAASGGIYRELVIRDVASPVSVPASAAHDGETAN